MSVLHSARRALWLLAVSLLLPAFTAHAANPLPFHGWTLTHDDMDYNLSVIGKMQEFGVTHVQLSHRIVTRVDQFQSEPEVVERVRTLASAIHNQGGQAIVWMQELNTSDTVAYCFDLDGEQMQAKMQAYRDALTAAPEIDGVMISFGSAPTELLYVLPSCNPIAYAAPKERYKAIIEAISRVVMDEFGKQVYVRTFYHKGHEIPILRNALKETDRPVIVMSKAEPNDFEPYYPLNPLIADVGAHDQFFELDCAGEYWGRGAIPFVAAEYFVQRYREAAAKFANSEGRFIGSTCRVDRYDYSAMGTLNEANLYAQALLVANPEASATTIINRFVESKYALTANSDSHRLMADILRRSYWVGRKMYYAKGEWAFKKGSDMPASNTDALSLMVDKSISQWDAAYLPITAALTIPSQATLRELLQEKQEAYELAQRNLEVFQALRSALNINDYNQIESLLIKQELASKIWLHMAGAIFSARNLNPLSANWAAWHLDQMEVIADQLDAQAYPQITTPYPFSSEDIREFVENERKLLLATDAVPLEISHISGVDVIETATDQIKISWLAEPGTNYTIELTQQLPSYAITLSPDKTDIAQASLKEFTISGLQPDSPYWFRIIAETNGDTVTSGDFTVWTRKVGEAEEEETDNGEDAGKDEGDEADSEEEPASENETNISKGGGGAFSSWSLLALALIQVFRNFEHRFRSIIFKINRQNIFRY